MTEKLSREMLYAKLKEGMAIGNLSQNYNGLRDDLVNLNLKIEQLYKNTSGGASIQEINDIKKTITKISDRSDFHDIQIQEISDKLEKLETENGIITQCMNEIYYNKGIDESIDGQTTPRTGNLLDNLQKMGDTIKQIEDRLQKIEQPQYKIITGVDVKKTVQKMDAMASLNALNALKKQ